MTLFIVGGGTSLTGFDFNKLKDERVWAINAALYDCPFAELIYWCDPPFYTNHKEAILGHSGAKLTGWQHPINVEYPDHVKKLQFSGTRGWEDDPRKIRSGNNSGFALLHYAIRCHERRIALLGFDMFARPDRSNYHSRHNKTVQDESYKTLMLHFFVDLVAPAKERGVKIINLSPQSAITCWPRMKYEDFIANSSLYTE